MTLIDKAEALLPCPFCGGSLVWSDTYREYHHPRAKCILSGHKFKKSAIAAWNRRSIPTRGVGEYTLAPHLQKIVDGAKTTPQWDTQADRLAALAPTDAAHVNETPKTEHEAGNVLTDAAQARHAGPSESAVYDRTGLPPVTVDAAQARDAALREAVNVCKVFQANARTNDAWLHACEIEEAILAMIGEAP